MRSHYKQAMDSLALSPEAGSRIRAELRRSRRRVRLHPAVAAAAVLILALGTTAMASGIFAHDIPAAIAQSLEPVQLSSTSQGITMTVQSAVVEDGVFSAYITMEDQQDGGRLAQGVDFYDSYRIRTPYRASVISSGCTPLGYDPLSESYGFLVTIQARDGTGRALDFLGKKFTFSIRQLLLGQTGGQAVTLQPDWSAIPPSSPDGAYYILGGSGAGFSDYSGWLDRGEAMVLRPGSWETPVMEGVSLSAAGFLNEQFHLQLRFDGTGPDDHGWINLVTPEGEALPSPVQLSFRDEEGRTCNEYVYDISPEELAGCSLTGEFTTGGYLLDGDWKVTFALEE